MITTIMIPSGKNIGKAIQQAVPAYKTCKIKFIDIYRDVKNHHNVAKIIVLNNYSIKSKKS